MPEPEELKEGYNRRLRVRIVSLALALPVFWFFTTGLIDLFAGYNQAPTPMQARFSSIDFQHGQKSTFLSQIGQMKDTVYTDKPNFLEIRLDQQMLYVHRRDSATIPLKISTGTERLEKGIKTRKGIFLVQNKIDWLYSVQFDSTKVFNWLGFNWGVGFHSLLGRGYYRYLGRRPSSHGCVRLGRNDAKTLFSLVTVGTPVMVHEGDAARVVSFATETSMIDTTHYSKDEVYSIYRARLQDLYQGNRLFRHFPVVLLDRKYIGHDGISIGALKKVPDQQKVPPISEMFYQFKPIQTSTARPSLKRYVEHADAMDKEKVEQTILP